MKDKYCQTRSCYPWRDVMKNRGIDFSLMVLLKGSLLFLSTSISVPGSGQDGTTHTRTIKIAEGWANNSTNTVVFRKNSVCSYRDTQFVSFYDPQQFVMLAKRKIGDSTWNIKRTTFKGMATDAHNAISITVDGDGYLHLAWNLHDSRLHYCKSLYPGSLDLSDEISMTGLREEHMTYPEFYRMPDGNLLFFYRDGSSGQGNMVINRYDKTKRTWSQLQSNLVDGEGIRNAYWQACVDPKGVIHLSWGWRETPDVLSNHDLCYARSADGGVTWENSKGARYELPIRASTAEYICHVPQNSDLINQTSIIAGMNGPMIATYWRDAGDSIPQYHFVYRHKGKWRVQNLGFRKTIFSLHGIGSKDIPISRPQVVGWRSGARAMAAIIFRDCERGNRVSIAISKNYKKGQWSIYDLNQESVGSWEPTFDTELWKSRQQLNLFVQEVVQRDAEGIASVPPQTVWILECNLGALFRIVRMSPL